MTNIPKLRHNAATKRASWMLAFEEKVVQLAPILAGKINWDSAHHYFYQNYTPGFAAEEYVRVRREIGEIK